MNTIENRPEWDAVVIGGSAAGLSAALMLGRARRRTLVVDAGQPRNRFASHMHGVLGHEGLPPGDLVAKGRDEAGQYGVEFRDGTVERVESLVGDPASTSAEVMGGDAAATVGVSVMLDDGATITARALIVATGMTDVLPDIPGLAERWGKSVLHCPYCHGWEVADSRLAVLATSPMSAHQAQMVRQWSDQVTVFTAGMGELAPELTAKLASRGIAINPAEVVEILGTGSAVTGVRTADGKVTEIDAIFTGGRPELHDGFLAALDLERTDFPWGEGSTLTVDFSGRTSHERIWAVGNVVAPMANVPMVIGAGATAGAAVNGVLIEEEFAWAVAGDAAADSSPANVGAEVGR